MASSLSFLARRAVSSLRQDVLVLPSRTLALAWAAGLLLLPLFSQDPYLLRIVAMTCIFAIYAASWDLLAGYAGQVSFGHALFFGVGAYGSALASLELGISPWLGLVIGSAMATAAGFAVGYLCLRLRGSYLSLATLAFPLITIGILFAFPERSGGELGVSGLRSLLPSRTANYYLIAAVMLALVWGLWSIADSRFGLVLHAIRDDEVAARASGINTPRYKVAAFGISACAAGIAGALYAHFMRGAGPSTLEVGLSFQAVIWGIFGGVATIYGPVVAVFVLYPLTEWLGTFTAVGELRLLIFAVVVLLVLLFMPGGLTPWVRDRIESSCPRCKERSPAWRHACRVCGVPLQPGARRPAAHASAAGAPVTVPDTPPAASRPR
jgi:branched-chain amino acid transport system permease protein